MKFGSLNKLLKLIIYYKFLKEPSYKKSLTTTPHFANKNICIEGDSNGSKSSYGPVLHSKIWMTYSSAVLLQKCPTYQHHFAIVSIILNEHNGAYSKTWLIRYSREQNFF
jgi:hypothetical protein